MDHRKTQSKLDKIESKIDVLDLRLDSIDITLAKQSVILDEHIKRSNMLEAKMEPVEKHVAVVHGVLKLIGIVSVLVGIIAGIIKIFS